MVAAAAATGLKADQAALAAIACGAAAAAVLPGQGDAGARDAAGRLGLALASAGVLPEPLASLGAGLVPAAVLDLTLRAGGTSRSGSGRAATAALVVGGGVWGVVSAVTATEFAVILWGTAAVIALLAGWLVTLTSLAAGPEVAGRSRWLGSAVAIAAAGLLSAWVLDVLGEQGASRVAMGAIGAAPLGLVLADTRSPAGGWLWAGRAVILSCAAALTGLTASLAVAVGLGAALPVDDGGGPWLAGACAAALAAPVVVAALSRWLEPSSSSPTDLVATPALAGPLPLEEVVLRLAESVARALPVESVEVWTGWGGVLRRVAALPHAPEDTMLLSASEQAAAIAAGVAGESWARVWLPGMVVVGRTTTVVALAHRGELVGLLVVHRLPSDGALGDRERRALLELAERAGAMVHSHRLDRALAASLESLQEHAEALRNSRARLVTRADAERRRIERDIHDGAQQRLVALGLRLRVARDTLREDPEAATSLLDAAGAELVAAVEELRALASGIFPPILVERGLGPALIEVASRCPGRVTVEPAALGRYPPDVEAAVFFCCREALQNVAKHAPGAPARLSLHDREGALIFEVADDGPGLADGDIEQAGGGQGLANMADRIGAVGGRLEVRARPAGGTRVRGTVPLPASAGEAVTVKPAPASPRGG